MKRADTHSQGVRIRRLAAAAALALLLTVPVLPALALEIQPTAENVWWDGVRDEWDESWDRAWNDDDAERWVGDSHGDEDYYPHRRGGGIRFRYEDDGYSQVYLTGCFIDWEREPMVFDVEEGLWEVHLSVDPGQHHYQFVVVDPEGEWTAIDPANFESRRLPERGRVSLLELDERRESRRNRRYDELNRVERELFLEGYDDSDGVGGRVEYQRVDGLVIGLSPLYVASRGFEPSVRGTLAYGFESDHWSMGLTVLQPLAVRNMLWFKVDGYHGTDYRDRTGIGTIENSLAMMFFRDDYRDYYQREGIAFSLVFAGLDWMRFEGGVRSDDYFSRANTSTWSWGKGKFRENLPVDEGSMRSAFGSLRFGKRYNYFEVSYERAGDDVLGGFAEFELVEAEWRSRLPLGPHQRLDVRVAGGSNLRGHLPLQRRFLLGGLGTVRGYDYQSLLEPHPDGPQAAYGGERMAFANVEYGFHLFDEIDLFALYDIGMTYEDREAEIDLDNMKQSAGIGFGCDDSGLRVNVMKPLDHGNRDPVVELRLELPF